MWRLEEEHKEKLELDQVMQMGLRDNISSLEKAFDDTILLGMNVCCV